MQTLKAQENQKFGAGLNVSDNLVNLALGNYKYVGGFSVEPVFLFKINKLQYIKTIVGYSKVSKTLDLISEYPSQQKLGYINEGIYFKVGIFTGFKSCTELFHNSFGLSLFYSQFNENGDVTIKGSYFGDYYHEFKSYGQKMLFLEPGFDIILYHNSFLSFSMSIKFPIKIYSSTKDQFPNYYIPGYGETMTNKEFNFAYILYRFEFYFIVPFGN